MPDQLTVSRGFAFYVLPPWSSPGDAPGGYLIADRWNDYRYVTMFDLKIRTVSGQQIDIGQVKVGQFDMDFEQWSPALDVAFDELDERFFSLGQDASYYEALRDRLDESSRLFVLRGLRDMAFDSDLYQRARYEQVTITSLLRYVNSRTVEVQFNRIAHGGASAKPFLFTYELRALNSNERFIELDFSVRPDSYPPTNIHALIGSNGVGKTRILRSIARAAAGQADVNLAERTGLLTFLINEPYEKFTNLVSVSFSAFDSLIPVEPAAVPHTFVTLEPFRSSFSASSAQIHLPLAEKFADSINSFTGARIERWFKALDVLSTDPIFNDLEIKSKLRPRTFVVGGFQPAALFGSLSSGHKIVLFAMARLVEAVEERTLVLIDEPETHLHPPLLSAFIRALCELLIDQNGVAILATHSPVVLQEMPRECVWKLRRSGDAVAAERPKIETFGENVGVLTREVFGLEVTRSGFHKMLEDAVRGGGSFNQLSNLFSGQLGGEALGLLRVLIAERDGQDRGPF